MPVKALFNPSPQCTVQTLAGAIRQHASEIPDTCAIADSHRQIDYRTLDRFGTRFALQLAEMGCKPGDRVVVLANRCAVVLAAIVGTFKSPFIHVPLDPQMPPNRLAYILADIAPAVVVTDTEYHDSVAGLLPPEAHVFLRRDLEAMLAKVSKEDHTESEPTTLADCDPDAPAYCIYTSGSTGRPKGVIIPHRSIAPFFDGSRAVYDVRRHSVCASFSPLHFDVFLMDMLFPLSQGATLRVFDDVVAPDFLFDLIRDNKITHFSAWGMMLGLIAQAEAFDSTRLPALQTILTGTDVPDIKTVQNWLAKNTGVTVLNAYGPTEATCASTAHVIREIEPERKALYPIGKPLKHVQILVVDDDDQPIDTADTPGELLVGGIQVMQAYWNRPQETEARLISHRGIRYYRTGDICSYLPDGSLFYHGRRDNEVNIGGRRVHLNEVQRVICSVPGVHSAEVVTFETAHAEQILAAAILLDGGRCSHVDTELTAIRQSLSDELPTYMVPRHIKICGSFPLLSSGKPDRRALLSQLRAEHLAKTGEIAM